MTFPLRSLALVGAVVLTATDAAMVAGQDLIRDERPVLRESVHVRAINLDAVVTDRSKNPVLDLEASDFRLRVDGERVAVTAVSRGSELRETVVGRLTVVILLDDRHLQPKHRNLVLQDILVSLTEEMEAHPTWVAVARLAEDLQPLLAPTRDVEALRAALAEARSLEVAPSRLRRQQRQAMGEVERMLQQLAGRGSTYRFGKLSQSTVLASLRSYGAALAHDTRQTLGGAVSLIDALAFVPGRKALLFVSDGLPRSPLDLVAKTMYDRIGGGSRILSGDDLVSATFSEGFNDTSARPTGSDRADNSPEVPGVEQLDDGGAMEFQRAVAEFECGDAFEVLSALANTHRVTFYPLKPPVTDASISGFGENTHGRHSITTLSDMTLGLKSLARATGGISFTADAGVETFLRQMRSDVSAYYSLSFEPPESMGDTGIRQMELKVRRRRSSLRYRASYMPLTLEESLSSRAWGTLLFEWQDNRHGLEVETRELSRQDQTHPVELILSLPIANLELVPSGGVAGGSFRIVLQLRREDGTRMPPRHIGFAVNIPKEDLEEAREQLFAVATGVELPPGRYDLAVGLWEENTGASSFVILPLRVGESEPPTV